MAVVDEDTAVSRGTVSGGPRLSRRSDGTLDQDEVLDIVDALNSDQPQVILSGPPGTSKTHAAVALGLLPHAGDEGRYRVVHSTRATATRSSSKASVRPQRTAHSSSRSQPGAVLRKSEDMSEGRPGC